LKRKGANRKKQTKTEKDNDLVNRKKNKKESERE
jgi:hypothetical protein